METFVLEDMFAGIEFQASAADKMRKHSYLEAAALFQRAVFSYRVAGMLEAARGAGQMVDKALNRSERVAA